MYRCYPPKNTFVQDYSSVKEYFVFQYMEITYNTKSKRTHPTKPSENTGQLDRQLRPEHTDVTMPSWGDGVCLPFLFTPLHIKPN